MQGLLALTWAGIIGFGIILYIILDGFDLGIGILSLFFRDEHDRDLMVSTILPTWDGNETWLVFGGAALYGAFPIAFSIILPLLYIPILIMIIALLFRGVAFEFRLKAIKTKYFWDICFFVGSLFATIAQGLVLGTFVQGFKPLSDGMPMWINPFGITCAIALIFGYALLGSNRLIIKTVGQLQRKCFSISTVLQYVVFFFLVIVSAWSPFLDPAIMQRWFNPIYMPYLALLPMTAILLLAAHWYALRKKYEHIPFVTSVGVFLVSYAGFVISCYPYIVPRYITYLQAASDVSSLRFMLVGACIMLPILLYYTFHSYQIFKGKVTERIGY